MGKAANFQGFSSTVILILAGVIILGAAGLYAGTRQRPNSNTPTGSPSNQTQASPAASSINKQLQLKPFIPQSPSPSTPASYSQSSYSSTYAQSSYSDYSQASYASYSQSSYQTCQSPTEQCGANHIPGCNCGVDSIVTCSQGACVQVRRNDGSAIPCDAHYSSWCSSCLSYGSHEGEFCFAKPVIYLYPTVITKVDVSVETTGQVVVSDPLYLEGGWKNVIASPDGTLKYQGQTYRELFYETSVDDFVKPKSGIVIKIESLDEELENYVTRLGLTRVEEREEFLDFWVPRLRALNSPYILFSILDQVEKEKTDKIHISPKPDTMIEFIAYFKPLPAPINISPLHLPEQPPERIGFTAVEWGGVID